MAFLQYLARNKQLTHWVVLLSLLLGQFALGFGYGIAAEQRNGEIRIPVCTSTGIEYIIWTPDGIKQDAQPNSNSSAGSCTLCTVSPSQLRFDIQDGLLRAQTHESTVKPAQSAQVIGSRFIINPQAAPRAPPVA